MHIQDFIHRLAAALALAKDNHFSTTLRMVGIRDLYPVNMGITMGIRAGGARLRALRPGAARPAGTRPRRARPARDRRTETTHAAGVPRALSPHARICALPALRRATAHRLTPRAWSRPAPHDALRHGPDNARPAQGCARLKRLPNTLRHLRSAPSAAAPPTITLTHPQQCHRPCRPRACRRCQPSLQCPYHAACRARQTKCRTEHRVNTTVQPDHRACARCRSAKRYVPLIAS